MGTRLRKLVKTTKVPKTVVGNPLKNKVKRPKKAKQSKKVSDAKAKGLGVKGRLTGKIIDKLTTYYGKAIHENCQSGSVDNMKNSIWATFYHYSSTDDNPQHEKCLEGETSWCEYQRAKALNQLNSFKHSYKPFPTDVLNAIKPICEDLTKEELLKRCLDGHTQNSNESYNQSVWEIMPKHLPASTTTVSIAAYITTCTFNEGMMGLLAVSDSFGIRCGHNAHTYATKVDQERITRSNVRAQQNTREARMLLRQRQIDASEAAIEEEGELFMVLE